MPASQQDSALSRTVPGTLAASSVEKVRVHTAPVAAQDFLDSAVVQSLRLRDMDPRASRFSAQEEKVPSERIAGPQRDVDLACHAEQGGKRLETPP